MDDGRLMEQRGDQVLDEARRLYCSECDWVTFYSSIFGPKGVVRRTFPIAEEATAFEQLPAYDEIQRMVSELRQRGIEPTQEDEPTRVITVRLPRSLHEALRHEAHRHQTSMNKLCISKLLQLIDGELVPKDL
jgi:hypothetical protein